MIDAMTLDRDACYRALRARDARFDGRLFVGVRTTGIYCRPICPARCPKPENVVFFPSAAAAQEAGFRACLRCRPEASPDLAAWHGTSSTTARALALIAEGALDGENHGVERLALRLGIGERQLRRLFERHLGASPLAVAHTRRLLFAKQLVHETNMRMIDVAMASGFGSLRRFNDAFRRLYARPPSALRREPATAGGGARSTRSARSLRGVHDERLAPGGDRNVRDVDDVGPAGITLMLSYAPPYDWEAMLAFFAARAIAGIEVVERGRYRRTIELEGEHGTIEIAPAGGGRRALAATIRFPSVKALSGIVWRLRRVFDLGADIGAITAHLLEDPLLAPLVAARPGLRVPGAWDGFELAVRAVLGQQVSVAAARRLAGRLVQLHGDRLTFASERESPRDLTHTFPRPERLAAADLSDLGMPKSRARAIEALAATALEDPKLFQPSPDLQSSITRLRAIPGIGEWTAQYIAMRALREPDAFPAADAGLLRSFTCLTGTRPTADSLLDRAAGWSPWRAYAAQHLWVADAATAPERVQERATDAAHAPRAARREHRAVA